MKIYFDRDIPARPSSVLTLLDRYSKNTATLQEVKIVEYILFLEQIEELYNKDRVQLGDK